MDGDRGLVFPYYYHLFVKLNKSKSDLQHFASTKDSRHQLVKNCFEAMRISATSDGGELESSSPELYIRKVIQGWFLDTPMIDIYYENFFAWSSWAFFGKEVSEMTEDEKAENKEIVTYIESEAKWKFPPGHSKDIHSARLTIDPVFSVQRPFFLWNNNRNKLGVSFDTENVRLSSSTRIRYYGSNDLSPSCLRT